MKSPGQILKEERLRQGLTKEDVEKATKIRLRFISALENDDYTVMPSLSYAKGFIKNYSDYLGLNTANILAFYRRQTKETNKSALLPKSTPEPLKASLFQLTPRKFMGFIVLALITVFSLYFGLQYRRLTLPPMLVVESPAENMKSKDAKVEIIGKTDPDSTVTINGVNVLIREDGKFFDSIKLEESSTQITVVATSRYGKSSEIKRTVEKD